LAEDLNIAGGTPPAFRNNLLQTGCEKSGLKRSIFAALACGNRLPTSMLFIASGRRRPAWQWQWRSF
jgi:hypothetical protein